jgi:ligand-binding sensor domain-containing protein
MATQILQDRREDWWITTRTRVLRVRGPGLRFEGRHFGAVLGLHEGAQLSGAVKGIHEDAEGRLWIAGQNGLYFLQPSDRGQPRVAFLPLVDFEEVDEINDVLSDRSGNIWLATHRDIARVKDGRIEPPAGRVAPVTIPTALFADSRAAWVGQRYQACR